MEGGVQVQACRTHPKWAAVQMRDEEQSAQEMPAGRVSMGEGMVGSY